jgi:acetyl-CoA carboxylase biotin carboxylase subunit
MFNKILIANRGEIALRIIRACKEMNILSVAVYSDADASSMHVKSADEAVNIGPALSRKSYLAIDNILEAAKKTSAEAIHPGYGFLSENETFAKVCTDNQVIFIGPSPETIALVGNKSEARKTLAKLDISVIPGSDEVLSSVKSAAIIADRVGYPVILKASGGGGGRGMRIADNGDDLSEAFDIASGEAQAAFGNPDLYIEKYIQHPRHIEFQILADNFGNIVHLNERECSIQKRYQKLIEESPSPFINPDLRARMGETAIQIARVVGYKNAGTMEFLVDDKLQYYFMEVNARVQVEHPVTEMVTGIDIVQEQIRISAGEALSYPQEEIESKGWAIECRINAADPENDFTPSPGQIDSLILPGGPGVRVDTHIANNDIITPYYDSLIGKLIVWAQDRRTAIMRMKRALSEFQVGGIQTTIPFFEGVMENEDFQKGNFDTHFLERVNK